MDLGHTDLGSAVTAALRESIVRGEIGPGERLVETELADRFEVSRGPIRDALAELERSGLVELRPRKGSFVRALTADDVAEIYSLRVALESLALRLAASTEVDISPLRAHLDALEKAIDDDDPSSIGAADMALHRSFILAADHRRLLEAWEALADQTLLMMATLPALDADIQGPRGAHRSIVDAVEAGDPEAAVAALTSHLEDARAAVSARLPAPS
ncbi:MAG: GntR family transcriptional regulator [Actinomycetota bacterium]